jgi:hypothetical protein
VDRVDPPAVVGLPDVMEECRPEQVRIVVTRLDQKLMDAQVMRAIEWCQPRNKTPLCVACQEPSEFRVNGWIGPAADGVTKLPNPPERPLNPSAVCRHCWGKYRHRHQNNDVPTIVETRKW